MPTRKPYNSCEAAELERDSHDGDDIRKMNLVAKLLQYEDETRITTLSLSSRKISRMRD